ncbi:hypothetical protein [Phenylobacterium montanum]|uniref:Uncharacterized protein n=1 Tax=Phenylobacterium montanum TaxID=2823693 RepID=A0A975G0N5_9CAUL|nr:hypothetical protein [Caulobacter sp. S6]QUD88611.1 hypothetical protein KCG34_01605 [Caulobacter sp. S6]
MISAIVTDISETDGLAATLASLTPAAIDGFVRELLVVGVGNSEALVVADDAGARIVESLDAATASARQPWLLVLPAGVRLQMNWEAAARGHISRHPEAAGWFRLNYAKDGAGARLAEGWANFGARWLGRVTPEHGLLISTRRWTGQGAGARPIEARILVGGG